MPNNSAELLGTLPMLKVIPYFEKLTETLNRWATWLAGGLLVALMLLTVANMVMREVWEPFAGTAEVVGFLAALVAALALGYTQLHRGHTWVDILVARLPLRAQAVIDSFMFFLATVMFGLATWQTFTLANHYWKIGLLSETLKMIFFPFIYVVALGCALLCLALLLDFLKSVRQVMGRK